MNDPQKTRTDLIEELEAIRARVAELESETADLKNTEKTLRKNEESWRLLAESAPNFVMIVDHEHTIRYINRAVSGYSIGETVGKSIYDFVEPEYHGIAMQTVNRALNTGEPGRYETRVTVPRVGSFWYETHVGRIERDGEIASATLISTDITDRKRAEEALRESEEKYRFLVNNNGYQDITQKIGWYLRKWCICWVWVIEEV